MVVTRAQEIPTGMRSWCAIEMLLFSPHYCFGAICGSRFHRGSQESTLSKQTEAIAGTYRICPSDSSPSFSSSHRSLQTYICLNRIPLSGPMGKVVCWLLLQHLHGSSRGHSGTAVAKEHSYLQSLHDLHALRDA